jgi:hypothetical protein
MSSLSSLPNYLFDWLQHSYYCGMCIAEVAMKCSIGWVDEEFKFHLVDWNKVCSSIIKWVNRGEKNQVPVIRH